MRSIARLVALALLIVSPGVALAQVELHLEAFGQVTRDAAGNSSIVVDQAGFREFAGDLGQILAPKIVGPADTPGSLGFDVGLDVSVTRIDESSSHWQKALGGESRSALTTIELLIRKGLPYSFEIGGAVSHLAGSDLWGMGLSLKYSFVEGFTYVPDIAVRTSISTVLGKTDMTMLMTGADLTVSKTFGVAGALEIAPYVGYSFLFVHASSFVLGTFPGNQPNPERFVIPQTDAFRHRAIVGVRMVVVHVATAFEMLLTDGIQTFTFRLGADF